MSPEEIRPLIECNSVAAIDPYRGWVYYDGDCGMCVEFARRLKRRLLGRGFGFSPIQVGSVSAGGSGSLSTEQWIREELSLPAESPVTEMLVRAEGRLLRGAEAVVYLARWIWWAWPLYAIAHLPGVLPVLRIAYRWVADRRHCLSGACRLPMR